MVDIKNPVLKSVRGAFSSQWSILGMLSSSISVLNLMTNFLSIGLSGFLQNIIEVYRAWIHGPIQHLFLLLDWSMPEPWAVDIALLWLLVGGIVLRSAWTVRAETLRRGSGYAHLRDPAQILFGKKGLLPLFLIYTMMAWPHIAILLLRAPRVYVGKPTENYGEYIKTSAGYQGNTEFLFDMRVVFLTQAIAVTAAVGAWLALNLVLRFYD